MFSPSSLLRTSRFVSSNRKVVFSVLAIVSLAAAISLSLRLAQSAPAAPAGPPVSPLPPPLPSVVLDVPSEVLIGEPMTFTVKFKNTGTTVGYGPFVDIVLDAGGANLGKTPPQPANPPCACDGITFVSAQMVGVNGGPLALPAVPPSPTPQTCASSSSPVTVDHPFKSSGVIGVALPAGGQLVTLALPFGSFEPNQPEITIEITVDVSKLADAGTALNIYARSGFRYGTDPLDNPTTAPLDPPILSDDNPAGTQVGDSTLWTNKKTTPTVMILKKAYSGPEDETATGPNFPRSYTLTVDIANGQTVSNVVLTDCLPDNMAFVQRLSVSPAASTVVDPAPPNVANNSPGSCLVVTWSSLLGAPGPDGTVVFEFFIPKDDANQNLILGPDCKNALSNNDIKATGLWTPADPCDSPTIITSDVVPNDHILTDKCIALQKRVDMFTDTGAPGLTPGDTVLYTINFQISDFKTFGELQVIDRLSDGQSLSITPATPAKLSVTDQYGSTSGDFILFTDLLETPSADSAKKCGVANGVTELTFKISQKMMAFAPTTKPRHDAGILTGGRATSNTAAPGATGKIEFHVKINDEFAFAQPGNEFVDKEDPINNCVDISGTVMTNLNQETPVPVPESPMVIAHDDSGTAIALVGDTLTKVVYAVQRADQFICAPSSEIVSLEGNCSNLPGPPQEVRPGDDVTFRIEKKIPSTDAEQLTIEDWLPLPIFNVTGFSFGNTQCAPGTVPLANGMCYHQLDTLHNQFTPNFIPGVLSNSIKFEYGDIFDMINVGRKIDLLFTSTVTNDPFADQLFLTNEVQECENNTFGPVPCQIAVAQVNLREPDLRVKKGIIATSNPNGAFTDPASPQTTPPTAQAPAGTTLSLTGITGVVNSTNLTGRLNSDLANVDANDVVTYAITIENVGGHPAFDVRLDDIFPPDCYTIVPNTTQVKLGSGASISNSIAPHPSGGFTLTVPGPIPEHDPTSGNNIVIVTYQVMLKTDITPGCCQNQGEIKTYSSVSNGPNFIDGGFKAGSIDGAEVCTRPTLTKSVVATSEAHTAPEPPALGTPDVTIGEIVRYRLVVRLPEGSSPNFQITDPLPAGMKFLDGGTTRVAFVSNGAGITHAGFFNSSFDLTGSAPPPSATLDALPPVPTAPPGAITGGTGCGAAVTFNLGDVQNNDNDSDLEFVVIEFNALVCNLVSNSEADTLSNSFTVSVNNSTIIGSNVINVTVREPNLTITKVVSPTTVVQGVTVPYTVTITNSSPVDAFDVQFADTLPVGLILDPASVSVSGCLSPTVVNTVPSVTCARIPVGGVVTITYKALADPITCPVTLTNNARVTWTSLPGPNGTTTNSPPMSTTPGASGALEGERNGVTLPLSLNDYAAGASAALSVICPPCVSAPAGIVDWWAFDEAAGTISKDIGGVVNNPGTHNNGPTPTSGKVGGALCFDGVNDYVEVADHPEINFPSSCPSGVDGAFTIDAWVRTSDSTGVDTILDKRVDPNQPVGYALFLVDGRLGFQLADGTTPGGVCGTGTGFPCTNYVAPPTSTNVASGDWHLVAVTVTKCPTPVGKMYVDGNLVLTFTPRTGNIDNSAALQIGRRDPAFSETHFNGCIDELEFFNRDLAESEIQAIYKARSSGKCKCPPITLNPAAGPLPATLINSPYKLTFTAGGGCSSLFTFSVTSGSLPPGLTLSPSGVLSGTPTQTGIFTFTVTATDSCGCTKSQTYTLSVDKCPMVPLALFNTGVANDGSLLAAGATDPHYALLNTSPVSPTAIVPNPSQTPAVWQDNTSIAQWIGPNVNPLSNSPAGDYSYVVTFTMPAGADLSTAIIAGQWASDNAAEIFLNGVSTGFTTGSADFASFKPFVITGPASFGPNLNTLEFRVDNDGLYTGLMVEMNGSVTCCPQPNKGTLIVRKNTVGGDNTFGYTTTGAGLSAFNITTSGGTQSQTFSNISLGAKTVTESSLPSGWFFNSLTCSDPDGGTTVSGQTANIDLDAGETVMCTYTNTKCAITLNPAAGPLPAAVLNIPYSQTFTATGSSCGASPTISVTGGALPAGLTLGANGVLSGTATQTGNFTFNVTAADSCGCSQSQTYTLSVVCPATSPSAALRISEFRFNGPNGSTDEFFEIFNDSPTDHQVGTTELSHDGGYGLFASAGNGVTSNTVTLVCRIPNGTIIPARGYVLCTGGGYSLASLGAVGSSTGSAITPTIDGAVATAAGNFPIINGTAGNPGIYTSADVPNDAGLLLANVGEQIVGASPDSGTCTFGFGATGISPGNFIVFDRVGFAPYGSGAPLQPCHLINPAECGASGSARPSLADNYCESTANQCLRPVGDASTTNHGSGVFYGDSGQYSLLRRQTTNQSATIGTVPQDTANNSDDILMVSPRPGKNIAFNITNFPTGLTDGVVSVLGAAGPQNNAAPPDLAELQLQSSLFDPTRSFGQLPNAERRYMIDTTTTTLENNPMGFLILRFGFRNTSTTTDINRLRFRVDNLSVPCGQASPPAGTGVVGSGNARNLSQTSPNCQGSDATTAVLKMLNLATELVSPENGPAEIVRGSVIEDTDGTKLAPNGGGVNNSLVRTGTTPGDLTGEFTTVVPAGGPGPRFFIGFRMGVVKGGRFRFLFQPEGSSN